MPAARLGDATAHGGVIVSGVSTVLICGVPAAHLGDVHVCSMATGPIPHVGGPVITGSATVMIGGTPAARVMDLASCVGLTDTIATGCVTVLIGGPATGGAGAIAPSQEAESAEAAGDSTTVSSESESAAASAPPLAPEGGDDQASTAAAEAERPEGEGRLHPRVGEGIHWIEIVLVDASGNPIPGESLHVRFPTGQLIEGVLDADGRCRIEGVEHPGECEISFPHIRPDDWEAV